MLTAARMSRSRLYVLFDSFEVDLRNLLRMYVLADVEEPRALAGTYEKASARRSAAGGEENVDLVEYLDMRDAYDVLNRNRDMLPPEMAREVRANTSSMDVLVPIRNRVMHGRPLRPGDPELAIEHCYNFTLADWPALRETLDHLIADPVWEPAFGDVTTRSDRILNNLPVPDYDETGLVGRSAEVRDVVDRLKRGRHPVVTLIGEGGIGKTALALEVAYSLLDDPESPFECILWSSLKLDRLTADGIADIADAVRDMTGATQEFGKTLDSSFSGSADELADMLDGIETLVILDNLETVDGRDVLGFVESLPDNVMYLFTSRVGIGQLERRKEVGPLADRDADRLFRTFARSRDVERLAKLPGSALRETVSRLRNSPLAIRWYVLSVEAGNEPNLALSNQADLLNFCVRSVCDAMSREANTLLAVLFALDRETSFDELVIYTSSEFDQVRIGIHELLRGSLVTLSSDREDPLTSRVALTQASREYLGQVEPPAESVVNKILAEEQEFWKSDEQRRFDERDRPLSPRVVRTRTSNDAPTAHILRLALTASSDGEIDRAVDLVAKARAMSPDFWEVDRVLGFIYSINGRIEPATAAYRAAVRRTDSEFSRAVVAYYFSSHLARRVRDQEAAISEAKLCHSYFDSADSANHLGTLLMWDRKFPDSQLYFHRSLETAAGHLRTIVLTNLADSWRRWAEYLMDVEHRPGDAISRAYEGFSIAHAEISRGSDDFQLAVVTGEAAKAFARAFGSPAVDSRPHLEQLESILKALISRKSLFARTRSWQYLPAILRKVQYEKSLSDVLAVLIDAVCGPEPSPNSVPLSAGQLSGRVHSWLKTFGFISHPDYPENVFFPASEVVNLPANREELVDLAGTTVRFNVVQDDLGRARAVAVELIRGV